MATANVVAVARTVLFRRVRAVLIRAHGTGLIANTLNFDYEVRSAEKAFSDLPAGKADEEMLDLALHISPLTEPTAASQPWPRERGLMPRRRHSRPSVNGSSTVQKTASLNTRERFRAGARISGSHSLICVRNRPSSLEPNTPHWIASSGT
jgi:hypothetical protein